MGYMDYVGRDATHFLSRSVSDQDAAPRWLSADAA